MTYYAFNNLTVSAYEEGYGYVLHTDEDFSVGSAAAVEELMAHYAPLEKWYTKGLRRLQEIEITNVGETLQEFKSLKCRFKDPAKHMAGKVTVTGYTFFVQKRVHFDDFEALQGAIEGYEMRGIGPSKTENI